MLESDDLKGETRPLTELEQLQGLLNNLIEYQERIVRETNAEIEETKEKIKVLRKDNK